MEWNGIVMSTAHSVQVAVSGAWSLSAKWAILRSTSPNSWQRDSGPCKDAQGHLNELELLVAFRENAFRENAPSLVQACCGARIRQREQRKKHSQQLGHTQFNSSTNKLSVLRARESICQ
jgi:hypothetical protein